MNENDGLEIERNNKLREVMEFRETLTEETDRGCALMAASFLDEQLRKMLETCLVDDPEKEKFFGPQAPLGSFSKPSPSDIENATRRVNDFANVRLQELKQQYQDDVRRLLEELREDRPRELENE